MEENKKVYNPSEDIIIEHRLSKLKIGDEVPVYVFYDKGNKIYVKGIIDKFYNGFCTVILKTNDGLNGRTKCINYIDDTKTFSKYKYKKIYKMEGC